jgi:hypothetical protein
LANEFEIKRGATFQLLMAVLHDDGTAFDVSGMTIASKLRNPANVVITTLTLTPGDTPSTFSITAATDTWPLGRLSGDFRIENGAITVFSLTFGVTVTSGMSGP